MKTALATLLWLTLSCEALAAGAIAVGEPDDVAASGLALAISWNQRTAEVARADALARCKTYQGVSQAVLNLCKVVREFSGECAATAYDPAPDTPGWGYGVAFTEDAAKDMALGACRLSAGIDRARFCAVKTVACDKQQGQ